MFGALTVGGLMASLLVAPLTGPVSEEPSIPTERVALTVITIIGSGCGDPAAVTASLADDNSSFTITFGPEYRASVGVGARSVDFRKNCQLNVILGKLAGFSFAISATHQRSHIALAAGATAMVRWNTYFAGQTQRPYQMHQFNGPFDAPWEVSEVPAPEALIWSSCGAERNYNLNTEVRVSAGTSNTATTTSSITLESTTYSLIWRSCPPT